MTTHREFGLRLTAKLSQFGDIFSKKKTFAHFKELFETSSTHVSVCSKNVAVSRKLGFKIDVFGSFCQFMRRWDQIDQNGLRKNDQ